MRIEELRATAAIAVLIASTMACATASPRQRPISKGPVETGPGTLTAARQFLEGRWSLQSFVVTPQGQSSITIPVSGVLEYDAYGNLQMEIKADDASSAVLRAAGIRIADGVISTTGRTVIDVPNQTLTYVVEGQPSSMWTGGGPLATNRPRHWVVEADVLTLTIRDDHGAPLSVSRWKKS
jgi:hypothetical protein